MRWVSPSLLPPEPFRTKEIVRLSREGRAPEEIIERIQESRTVYIMDAEDVFRLGEGGVDHQVIDAMLRTQRRAPVRTVRYGYVPSGPCWYPRYPYYPCFPPPYVRVGFFGCW